MPSTAYYTDESIEEVSRRILEECGRYRKHHPIRLREDRFALLIVDMQKHYVEPGGRAFIPSSVPVVGRIAALARRSSDCGAPVIATRHTNTDANAGMMSVWWPSILTPDDPSSEIVDELLEVSDVVVEKHRYNAFEGSVLEEVLEDSEVSQLIVSGVMTNLCCDSTTRAGFDLGYECYFLVDGTAAYTEELHRSSVTGLSYGYAVPVLTAEVAAMMDLRE